MDYTLYNGVSSPPHTEQFLCRPQIDSLLESAMQKPLVTVVAGAGFGKTQTVSAFLRRQKTKVIWLALSTIDNLITRFWEHFVYALSLHNASLAATFSMIDFPGTTATFSAFLQIMAQEVDVNGAYFLVFDDFHLIHEKRIVQLTQELAHAQIKGLTIIIISRTDVPINTLGLMSKGLLASITEDHLRFHQDETASYFTMKNIRLSEKALSDIYEITDGWAFAVYLIGLILKQGIVYDKIPLSVIKFDMYKLIDAELFSTASKELQDFLVKLSLLDNLQAELLQALSAPIPGLMQELMNFKSFMQYDRFDNCYRIHALLLNFLREKQAFLSVDEIRAVHKVAAEWYADNGYKMDAASHYEKAGAYEKLLPFLSGVFDRKSATFALEILDRIPEDAYEKNPLLLILRTKMYVPLFRLEEAVSLLAGLREKVEALPPSSAHTALLGEICCLLGFISLITSFADRNYQFIQFFKMAEEYLPEGSALFDGSLRFNKGTYACMVSAEHYNDGTLDRYLQAMAAAMPYIPKVMNGSGYGNEHLQRTEAAYFKKDLKNAQKYAQQAIYTSQEKGQYDIENMAVFYLIRIHLALCNYEEIQFGLERMKIQAEKHNNTESHAMLHIAEGWYYAAIGQTDKVQDWIKRETDDYMEIIDSPFSVYRLVRAKCHLAQKSYYELLAFAQPQGDPYELQNVLIGAIEVKALKAVALYLVNEKAEAVKVLEEAYTLAQPNGLIMPFVEQGTHMRTLTNAAMKIKSCTIPAQWLETIHVKSSSYAKNVNRIASEHQLSRRNGGACPVLTQRELEVLSNLCNGLTREEISVECNLSVNTIKSMLHNIYKKLGAINSYDAVRIASKMNIQF